MEVKEGDTVTIAYGKNYYYKGIFAKKPHFFFFSANVLVCTTFSQTGL